MSDPFDPIRPPAPPKFVFVVFGLIFAGIGIAVLVFLWSRPFGQFGAPPLVFRIIGSFIALAFVTMGAGMAVSLLARRRGGPSISEALRSAMRPRDHDRPPSSSRPAYTCPHCGAPLADGADVSPHGDVKCSFCNSWFNVH